VIFAPQPSSPSKHLVTDLFITDVIAYYVRMGAQPVCFQVYAVKVGSVGAVPSRGTASVCSLLLAVLCKAHGISRIWAALSWSRCPPALPLLTRLPDQWLGLGVRLWVQIGQ